MSEATDPAEAYALVRTTPLAPASDAHGQPPGALLGAVPTVRAAAAAAGGFALGAVLVGLFQRRRRSALVLGRRRGLARRGRGARGRAGKGAELLEIVASRSLLVDVHLLGGRGER